jgi:hypothetical protein
MRKPRESFRKRKSWIPGLSDPSIESRETSSPPLPWKGAPTEHSGVVWNFQKGDVKFPKYMHWKFTIGFMEKRRTRLRIFKLWKQTQERIPSVIFHRLDNKAVNNKKLIGTNLAVSK